MQDTLLKTHELGRGEARVHYLKRAPYTKTASQYCTAYAIRFSNREKVKGLDCADYVSATSAPAATPHRPWRIIPRH